MEREVPQFPRAVWQAPGVQKRPHNSKELNLKLEEVENLRRVQLIHLPPYSPDKNPIEHVWNEAKNSISNIQRADFEDTRDAFETFIRETKFKYRLMKSS